jgi:gas vesicle protein
MRKGYFFDGVLLGAIIGVIGGLLFAPSTGEETRKKLKKIGDDNEELINETKAKSEELIQKTMESIETGFDKLGKMIEERKA